MKVSFISFFALSTCFLGVLSAPTVEANTDVVEKRQISSAYSIVDSLFSDIKQYTGAINATAAGLSSSSTQADNATAAAAYRSNVKQMTKRINDATKKVNALSKSTPSNLEARQATSPTALATLVTNLLLEVGGALNQIIGTLGLSRSPPPFAKPCD
ncbi:hypothetical protein B0A49_09323 [Cryomyces minteri]|uniref:Cell wall protein n=1 Tax=Cryomyces minteri TaxID=331657 RepID=A0A4U0WJA1_9PEZI|nr:hypothetical protein B0A49_09323 [Cryomyces minteri]